MSLRPVVFAVLMLMTSLQAGEPTLRPSIPALVVGGGSPESFLVTGIVRFSSTGGMGFYVAADENRQFCALYDAVDKTPVFLSDGRQTLVYDFRNRRIVRVPASRGSVSIDWKAQDDHPLKYHTGISYDPDPKKLITANPEFRIDRFVETSPSLTLLETDGHVQRFEARRKGGSVESVEYDQTDPTWFRFTSKSDEDSFLRIELHATAIHEKLPEIAFAFPDIEGLSQQIMLTDLDRQRLPKVLTFIKDGPSG